MTSTTAGRWRSSRSVFCSAFMSQPLRMNSVASQSSNSGWTGPLALRAEVLDRLDDAGAEEHLPVAVDGHARGQRVRRSTSQRARPSRLFGVSAASGGKARAGTPASPSRRACRTGRACSTNVSRGFGISSMTIVVGNCLDELRRALAQITASAIRSSSRDSRACWLEEVRARACASAPACARRAGSRRCR